MLDIPKDAEIFVCYCSMADAVASRQAALSSYGFRCTCLSCTDPSFDDQYQSILSQVTQLSASFNEWTQNRSLPNDHLIKPALNLLSLMEANGLHGLNIYEINLVTLMTSYTALGDLSNTMKYATLCGLWHLYREQNAQLCEGLKNPRTHRSHPLWGVRA
jgi:hypothetical protein